MKNVEKRLKRTLEKMRNKQKIKDASFENALELPNLILILKKENVGDLIGKKGRIVRVLSQELGKKVRIVKSTSFKELAEDMILPARLKGVNVLYKPEEKIKKVRIVKRDKKNIVLDEEVVQKALRELAGVEVELEFEPLFQK